MAGRLTSNQDLSRVSDRVQVPYRRGAFAMGVVVRKIPGWFRRRGICQAARQRRETEERRIERGCDQTWANHAQVTTERVRPRLHRPRLTQPPVDHILPLCSFSPLSEPGTAFRQFLGETQETQAADPDGHLPPSATTPELSYTSLGVAFPPVPGADLGVLDQLKTAG